MPALSRWFIRLALAYLALGTTIGATILATKAVGWWLWSWRLLPLHMEMLLSGWLLQLAMGVAYWILPRFHQSRGDPRPAWSALVLLNVGVILVGATAALGWSPAWIVVGRTAELAAVAAFAVHAWPRVKPPARTQPPRGPAT